MTLGSSPACRVDLLSGAEQCFGRDVWGPSVRVIADNGMLLIRDGLREWRVLEPAGTERTVRTSLDCSNAFLEPSGGSMLCEGPGDHSPKRWSAIDLTTGESVFLGLEGDGVVAASTSADGERWAMLQRRDRIDFLTLQWRDGRDRVEFLLTGTPTGVAMSVNGGVTYYSTTLGIWAIDWHTREPKTVLRAPAGANLSSRRTPGGPVYTGGEDPPANAEVWVGDRLAPRIRGGPRAGWQIPWESAEDGPGMPIVMRFGDPYFEVFGGRTTPFFSPSLNVIAFTARPGERMPTIPSYAWHEDRQSLVTSNTPARRGEVIHTWWAGLGAVDPVPGPGELGPSEPESRVLTSIEIRDPVADRDLELVSAVLRPGHLGEYLIATRVPADFNRSELTLDVRMGGRSFRFGPIPVRVN